jgi:hypothetical protein
MLNISTRPPMSSGLFNSTVRQTTSIEHKQGFVWLQVYIFAFFCSRGIKSYTNILLILKNFGAIFWTDPYHMFTFKNRHCVQEMQHYNWSSVPQLVNLKPWNKKSTTIGISNMNISRKEGISLKLHGTVN